MSSQQTANHVWLTTLDNLINFGSVAAPRGKKIKEFLGYTSTIDMNYPIVMVPGRALGYKFQAAEAAWILGGQNDVASIAPYAAHISKFSDDGIRFAGSYGPKIIEQLSYICKALADDQDTRQAVMTIWRERPAPSKDIPCTVSIQWFIRDNKLHCIDHMRSSDIWLGWPYDVFNFSMLSFIVRSILRDTYQIEVDIGELRLIAGSQHLYESNLEAASALVNHYPEWHEANSATEIVGKMNHVELVDFLWEIAKSKGTLINFGGREA